MAKTSRKKRKNRVRKWSQLYERWLSLHEAMERKPQQEGYGAGMNHSGYGSYGGGFGRMYGGGNAYGNGGIYESSGMNGGGGGGGGGRGVGMYNFNGGFGSRMGDHVMGGRNGVEDPNNPFGAPASPPPFWISFLRVMQRVVNFIGRISILIDQNTQAIHMFMSALLQLFDCSGSLYGEVARFVLRLLGMRRKPKKVCPPAPHGLTGHQCTQHVVPNLVEESKAWDSVWATDGTK